MGLWTFHLEIPRRRRDLRFAHSHGCQLHMTAMAPEHCFMSHPDLVAAFEGTQR
jgi:hypothetical protein